MFRMRDDFQTMHIVLFLAQGSLCTRNPLRLSSVCHPLPERTAHFIGRVFATPFLVQIGIRDFLYVVAPVAMTWI
jgi:hypothetical protein